MILIVWKPVSHYLARGVRSFGDHRADYWCLRVFWGPSTVGSGFMLGFLHVKKDEPAHAVDGDTTSAQLLNRVFDK